MVVFLSPEWISRLDAAVRADPELKEATADLALVVEQHITRPDGPAVTYRVVFDHGENRVETGGDDGDPATVRFTQDRATAAAITRGELSAQRAFMTGLVTVGGDLRALVDHRVALGSFADVFGTLRAQTTFDPEPEPILEA